jgi:hydroxymethylbilane synthase
MGRIYRVGTRTSPLALRQVEEILVALNKFYSAIDVDIVGIDTYGDEDKATPISQIEGTDFFTKEIDDALLIGKIDFAIHSAKDLPADLKKGLVIAAITSSIDRHDVLVSKANLTLDKLPPEAKIGTSSLRRKRQLKKYRDDFQIIDLRGNIEERLKILDEVDLPHPCAQGWGLDAIVIAAAGLIRLGLVERITQRIPFRILEPHPLQGALAVVVRDDDSELFNLLAVIDSRRGNFSIKGEIYSVSGNITG